MIRLTITSIREFKDHYEFEQYIAMMTEVAQGFPPSFYRTLAEEKQAVFSSGGVCTEAKIEEDPS